jgi:hypothetical protein
MGEGVAEFSFEAEVIYWRGPAPFYFAAIPAGICAEIAKQARALSYGWGVIPVAADIRGVVFRTSLFPKDGGYLLPLKAKVRAQLGEGELTTLRVIMTLGQAATFGSGPT